MSETKLEFEIKKLTLITVILLMFFITTLLILILNGTNLVNFSGVPFWVWIIYFIVFLTIMFVLSKQSRKVKQLLNENE